MSYTYDRRAARYMEVGKWYKQSFSDEVLYFLAKAEQKNGGLAGIQVTVDLTRPRAAPKAKKISVPKSWVNLWTEVRESEVPENVKAQAG